MEETIIPKAEATLKYARISSRKVKIVADLIKGKDIDEALAILKFTPKASSEIIEKLLKRIRPAAKGSAVRIRKRTSHITIVLKERE